MEHRRRVLSEGSLGQEGFFVTQSLTPWNPSWSLLAFVNHKLSPGTHYVSAPPYTFSCSEVQPSLGGTINLISSDLSNVELVAVGRQAEQCTEESVSSAMRHVGAQILALS